MIDDFIAASVLYPLCVSFIIHIHVSKKYTCLYTYVVYIKNMYWKWIGVRSKIKIQVDNNGYFKIQGVDESKVINEKPDLMWWDQHLNLRAQVPKCFYKRL